MVDFVVAHKGAVIDLDQVVGIFHDESGFNSMSGRKKSITIRLAGDFSVTVLESDENYPRWSDFLSRIQPLKTSEDERRIRIVSGAFDPFIDSERLTAIYSLFHDIPTHDSLLLCLESEETGYLRRKDNPNVVVMSWQSAVEAVDRLHEYRASLRAGDDEYPGDEEAHEWAADHSE